jgi:hypothetical protein
MISGLSVKTDDSQGYQQQGQMVRTPKCEARVRKSYIEEAVVLFRQWSWSSLCLEGQISVKYVSVDETGGLFDRISQFENGLKATLGTTPKSSHTRYGTEP